MRIAAIGGDGIGPEVTAQACHVLAAVAPELAVDHFDLGAARYLRTGQILPESELARLDTYDAILLGAVGDPQVPPGILERGLLLALRFAFDQYVNLRPSRLWPGTSSPLRDIRVGELDLVVVREGTEGLYTGAGGALHVDTPAEIATEESLNTWYGTQRVVRDAFRRAKQRRRKLTWVHKTNVLAHAGALWSRVVREVGAEFPEVECEYQHVDAAAMHLVTRPWDFDVIVTDNLFGDIVTDIAASVSGGIGLAASGNVNPDRTHPSMFEPVHGSAPDIAGTDAADPVAAILSAAMLLDHLGLAPRAAAVRDAVATHLAQRDPHAAVSTIRVGQDIADKATHTQGE